MRIGIDLGGTKIEAIAMTDDSKIVARHRLDTPQGRYQDILDTVASLVAKTEDTAGPARAIGIGAPGSINPLGTIMQNCNSVCLNGKNLPADLQKILNKPVRIANDADCFTLSEAKDGAAKDFETVFGVILGTGVGGGFVARGHLLHGPNALTGEWGHNPLHPPEHQASADRPCFCGRSNCIETWVSGPAIAREYNEKHGTSLSAKEIAANAEPEAVKAIDTFLMRLAASLGPIINSVDPHCIVFGGGLSNIDRIYSELPSLLPKYILPDTCLTKIVKAEHGDSSGVRGAAWLWP